MKKKKSNLGIGNISDITFFIRFGIISPKVLQIHFLKLFVQTWFYLLSSVEFHIESLKIERSNDLNNFE